MSGNPQFGRKLTKSMFENLISNFWGFPEGFEHFGPHIRIPREKSRYIVDWKRLETSSLVKKCQTSVSKKLFFNLISSLMGLLTTQANILP